VVDGQEVRIKRTRLRSSDDPEQKLGGTATFFGVSRAIRSGASQ